MAKSILKCPVCNAYTLEPVHCNMQTLSTRPAKFSPEKEEKYSKYRIKFKNGMENRKNIKRENK